MKNLVHLIVLLIGLQFAKDILRRPDDFLQALDRQVHVLQEEEKILRGGEKDEQSE